MGSIALSISLGVIALLGGSAVLIRRSAPSIKKNDAKEGFFVDEWLSSKGGMGDKSPHQSDSGSSRDCSIPNGKVGVRDYILEKPNLPPLSSSSAISSREEFRPRADKVGSRGSSKFSETRYYDGSSPSSKKDDSKKDKGASPLVTLGTWLAKALTKLSTWLIIAVFSVIVWLIKQEDKKR